MRPRTLLVAPARVGETEPTDDACLTLSGLRPREPSIADREIARGASPRRECGVSSVVRLDRAVSRLEMTRELGARVIF